MIWNEHLLHWIGLLLIALSWLICFVGGIKRWKSHPAVYVVGAIAVVGFWLLFYSGR